jgi:hypothetical protein
MTLPKRVQTGVALKSHGVGHGSMRSPTNGKPTQWAVTSLEGCVSGSDLPDMMMLTFFHNSLSPPKRFLSPKKTPPIRWRLNRGVGSNRDGKQLRHA